MTTPTRRYGLPARSTGRWSVRPAWFVLVITLVAGSGYGLGFVAGKVLATDRGREYCATYGTMTGTTTRYAAGECWLQLPDTPGTWYPLHDPEGAR